MKSTLFLLIIAISFCAKAQYKTSPIPLQPKSTPNYKIPEWMDTTNKVATKYGYAIRLKQDNMPCIMPYDMAVMPNLFNKNESIPFMPNLWNGDSTSKQMLQKKKK